MVDGEGHIEAGKQCRKSVQIANTERAIIDTCAAALDLLGIEHKVKLFKRPDGRLPVWVIHIHKWEALDRYAACVPMAHPQKAARLREVLSRTRYRRLPAPPREQLDDLYWRQGQTMRQVAESFGVTQPTIGRWMERYGIPRRTRKAEVRVA